MLNEVHFGLNKKIENSNTVAFDKYYVRRREKKAVCYVKFRVVDEDTRYSIKVIRQKISI